MQGQGSVRRQAGVSGGCTRKQAGGRRWVGRQAGCRDDAQAGVGAQAGREAGSKAVVASGVNLASAELIVTMLTGTAHQQQSKA
jgi:hypothetical protein